MLTNHTRGGIVRSLAAAACLLCAAGPGEAQVEDVEQVRVTLANGDVVTGEVVSRTDENITIENDAFGQITIPMASVGAITPLNADGEEAPAEEEPADAEEAIEEAEEQPWEIRFELGASGSRGNTDRDNIRTAIAFTRETDKMFTRINGEFRWAAEDGETTENRTFVRGRNDWKIADSPWSLFAQADADIDDFKDYDIRVSAFGGVGYRFIDKPDEETLQGRFGLGASRPFGAVENDEWVFEALLGIDYYLKINDKVTFTALAEYFPDLEDTREFRARGEAALEIALDNDNTWFLRLNVEDRYESQVGPGVDKNDLFYGAAILLVF